MCSSDLGGTAQALSAANPLLLGTREAYQKDLLAEKGAAAIHTAMQARRNAVALRLRTGLSQPLLSYPLPVALNDLHAYVRAGSLLGALTEITDQVAVQATSVEADIKDSVVADYAARDAVAKSTEAALCTGTAPCKTPDPARVKKLGDCAKSLGLAQPDAALSLIDGAGAIPVATRRSALNCLNKPAAN